MRVSLHAKFETFDLHLAASEALINEEHELYMSGTFS